MPTYRCDVLIVGGGILGLWVLERLLNSGYRSPILLETDLLACRQTGHSDAFLHQGYAYYSKAGAEVFIDAWNAWQPWLPLPVPPVTVPPAYHVYLKSSLHQAAIRWWNGLGVPLPPQHQHNAMCPAIAAVHDALETDERCVPGDWIVARLADGKRDHFQKVDHIDRITLGHDPTVGRLRVQFVEVVVERRRARYSSRAALLLCAGQANQSLLDSSRWVAPGATRSPRHSAAGNELHDEVALDMIVASDSTGTLPVFNGSVTGESVLDKAGQSWNVRAFVVSREDLGWKNRVWIASGRVDRTDSCNLAETMAHDRTGLSVDALIPIGPLLVRPGPASDDLGSVSSSTHNLAPDT